MRSTIEIPGVKLALYPLCAMLGLGSPAALAMTGAELLQSNKAFATGYVFGIVDMQTTMFDSDDKNWLVVRECVINSHLNARGTFDLVESYLRRNPKRLTEAAVAGVLNSVNEMCNPSYKP
jgi:uncharacterized lipoprotein NlpE involved in copper resistance